MDFGTNTILVTGAAGWLGQGLVSALLQGLDQHEALRAPLPKSTKIRCLVLPGQDGERLKALSDQVEIVVGDVRKPEDCQRFCEGASGAVLFHTAGVIHPRRVAEFYTVNFAGTKNLLDAAIAADMRRAVVVSSNSPCGCNPHPDHLFDEDSPYHPYMNYGRSKMEMEKAVLERQRRGAIETVIVRAPWFYGPHQPPRQTLFFRMVRDGKVPVVGRGDNLRSMVYIDNLCAGLLLAALVDSASGQTYWIADRRPYSMNEIIETVACVLEDDFQQRCTRGRLQLPSLAGRIAYLADASLQRLGLYHQKIHVLSEMDQTIACSVAKAQSELGYTPSIELKEGMRRSLTWLAEQGITL